MCAIGTKTEAKFDQTENLLLAGSSGTGKTIVLAEALHMRIAHYMRDNVPLNIIIAIWHPSANKLVEDLKQKYFPSLSESKKLKEKSIDVKVHDDYESLINQFGVAFEDWENPKVKEVITLLEAVSKSAKRKTLLFLDELDLEVTDGLQDFTKLSGEWENVDFFIAISPWGEGDKKHDFVPTESPRILARQLQGRHRNSAQIQYLNMHWIGDETLNGKGDRIDQATLPEGKMPLLILRGRNIPNGKILRFIEEGGHISKDQRVTVITNVGNDSEVDRWCGEEDGEQRKQVQRSAMTGCEDDAIITFDWASPEETTRAREMLIVVAELGSSM